MILAPILCFGGIPTYTALNPQRKSYQPLSHTEGSQQKARTCECFDLHKEIVPYGKAWSWQKQILKEKELIERNGDCPHALIVLQHHPAFTMGTGTSEGYLNFDRKKAPFNVYRTDRGGEVTYHGPGQGILSSPYWNIGFRDHKLAAVGIRVLQWITYHGLALNVTTDLTPFSWMVPCGLRNRKVRSIEGLLEEFWLSKRCEKADIQHHDDCEFMDISYKSLIKEFSEVFQLEVHQKTTQMSKIQIENC